jgi:capsular polysaccharide biosynthesis protein
MDPKKKDVVTTLRQVLTRDQIMSFVSGLHETQRQMIELTVASKEKQGFPEASAVIRHIMEKK